jgi:hypothetical protein
MAKELYCWRCGVEVPMLDENEWARMQPHLHAAPSDPFALDTALDLYEEMTGLREPNINAIFHHRIADQGPPCASCGKPLRTPKASFCAACGTPKP